MCILYRFYELDVYVHHSVSNNDNITIFFPNISNLYILVNKTILYIAIYIPVQPYFFCKTVNIFVVEKSVQKICSLASFEFTQLKRRYINSIHYIIFISCDNIITI